MKEKLLKLFIYTSGLICLYIFLSIRSLPMLNSILVEKIIPQHWEFTKYGEMYYFNYISSFKKDDLPEPMPKYRLSKDNPDINEANILTFGDSFFDYMRQRTFPQRLGDTLNKKVFFERFSFPLEYLENNNYQRTERPKLLIYETTERYIAKRFSFPHPESVNLDTTSAILANVYSNSLQFLFPYDVERLYTQVLKRSYFSTKIYGFIADFKFKIFGYISSMTPKYVLDDNEPWLFYKETVDENPTSFYYQHSSEEIQLYCYNIKELSEKLKDKYNLILVFMPLPNKYTIYHTLINNDRYNNLLPMIYSCLESMEIPVVKVYDSFMSSEKILYYGTDTHWNKNGIDLTLNIAMPLITNLNEKYNLQLLTQ